MGNEGKQSAPYVFNAPPQGSIGFSPIRSSRHRLGSAPPLQPMESSARHSPATLSISSDQSHHSSLSHGSSPMEDEALAFSPDHSSPGDVTAKSVRAMKRPVQEDPTSVTNLGPGEGFIGCGPTKESRDKNRSKEGFLEKMALGFRVCGFLFSLISFSVMAADRNQGWAIDSFYRYKEFRYCISMNVIGFLYSGVQACLSAYNLVTGNDYVRHQIRFYLDFLLDQLLAYLLISASSSAATLIDYWESNWGKDKFPEMASASVGMSFLAFLSSALSSLVSGYLFCSSKPPF